jgi:hypothetical protein
MPFKEIKELRQSGRLEEALSLALTELEEASLPSPFRVVDESGNIVSDAQRNQIWQKRALSWVYYDYLKKAATEDDSNAFLTQLQLISDLMLPESENMLYDSCAYQIGKEVFKLAKKQPIQLGTIDSIFDIIKAWSFTKPDEAYTFLFKAFHKCHTEWSHYLEFLDWWGVDNFRNEDYDQEEYNGKKIISLVEQAYIGYAKKLLELHALGIAKEESILNFMETLDLTIKRRPDYTYLDYYKAKLILVTNSEENALEALIPFAKKKSREFWLWQLMAEAMQNDKDMLIACYCKALSLSTQEDFLVKLRQNFAQVLIDLRMYPEAKFEIDRLRHVRTDHEWKIPAIVQEWTNSAWYNSTNAVESNIDLYRRHKKQAEMLLHKDVASTAIAVEFVNSKKKVINFVHDSKLNGFFKYEGEIETPEVGEVLLVKFKGDSKDNYYQIWSAERPKAEIDCPALKNFNGTVRSNSNQEFGFVESIFISPDLMISERLKGDEDVTGKAILAYNKLRETWGWKAIEIKPSTE